MNARQIQQRIILERYSRSFVLPNYTPTDWWECDVFEITDAGYFIEYEIKLTKGDYQADALKDKVHPWWSKVGGVARNKHADLAAADVRGPSRFYFVCPDSLLTVDQIPPWAGLIHARALEGHRAP